MPDDREQLGRLVHDTRLAIEAERAAEEGRERFRLGSWEQRPPHQQAADTRIAETVAQVVCGRFGEALREHWLAGISWDRARHEVNPVCACSGVFLGWHVTTGGAVEAWIGHVMEVERGEEGSEAKPGLSLPLAADPAPPELDGQLQLPGTETRPWPYDGPEGRARLTGSLDTGGSFTGDDDDPEEQS